MDKKVNTQLKPRILLASDFAVATGFSTVSQNLVKYLQNHYTIDVLGINYNGDPHPLQRQFNIYVPTLAGDVYGVRRIVSLLKANNYDMVFFINDAWIIMQYLAEIKRANIQIPIVSYIPIDAKHIKPHFVEPLNETSHVIAYTEFGLNELKLGGLKVPHSVIPHGVDTTMFQRVPMADARKEAGLDPNWFVVLSVARN
jgi:hypothetical protein